MIGGAVVATPQSVEVAPEPKREEPLQGVLF